jgi:hypothetical protein
VCVVAPASPGGISRSVVADVEPRKYNYRVATSHVASWMPMSWMPMPRGQVQQLCMIKPSSKGPWFRYPRLGILHRHITCAYTRDREEDWEEGRGGFDGKSTVERGRDRFESLHCRGCRIDNSG